MDRQKLFDSFIEFMGRFAQLKAVAALRDGFIMTTPFTICGSVFLLLAVRQGLDGAAQRCGWRYVQRTRAHRCIIHHL